MQFASIENYDKVRANVNNSAVTRGVSVADLFSLVLSVHKVFYILRGPRKRNGNSSAQFRPRHFQTNDLNLAISPKTEPGAQTKHVGRNGTCLLSRTTEDKRRRMGKSRDQRESGATGKGNPTLKERGKYKTFHASISFGGGVKKHKTIP